MAKLVILLVFFLIGCAEMPSVEVDFSDSDLTSVGTLAWSDPNYTSYCDITFDSGDKSVEFLLEDGTLTIVGTNVKNEKEILKLIYILMMESFSPGKLICDEYSDINSVTIEYKLR